MRNLHFIVKMENNAFGSLILWGSKLILAICLQCVVKTVIGANLFLTRQTRHAHVWLEGMYDTVCVSHTSGLEKLRGDVSYFSFTIENLG